ncbi:hypothetical protein N136_03623, partial [Leifsonia aquatica ATCC 14665]
AAVAGLARLQDREPVSVPQAQPALSQPALSLAEVESLAVPVMLAELAEAAEFDRLAAKVEETVAAETPVAEPLTHPAHPARTEQLEVA